jgi:SAM-dependent methyltransferase
MRALLDLLREPGFDEDEVDGVARLSCHRAILERKRMVREVFLEIHGLFRKLEARYLDGAGIRIEVGAGVAPMRDSFQEVLSTDIVFDGKLDFVMDAQRMGLAPATVRAVYAQNSFHHFPDPGRFLAELERVLSPGGGAILLEPYYGPLATFVYKRLFRTEGFDKHYPSWQTPSTGPMNGANQALSYIVFVRDRALLESHYPLLRLVHQAPVCSYLRYLVSGGLNFRQLLPDMMSGPLRLAERVLSPFNRLLALHHVVVLRKVAV